MQIISVLLVTIGIVLTTLSASQAKSRPVSISSSAERPAFDQGISNTSAEAPHSDTVSFRATRVYLVGILLLTTALILSGLLGILQDRTFAAYGRTNWQESMFYLHALALPMFLFIKSDIAAEIRTVNEGPRVEVGLRSLVQALSHSYPSFLQSFGQKNATQDAGPSSFPCLLPLALRCCC